MTNATANAQSAILMFVQQRLFEYATSVALETTKTNVWYAVVRYVYAECSLRKHSLTFHRESQMPSTASNVPDWKRIEMDVPRL